MSAKTRTAKTVVQSNIDRAVDAVKKAGLSGLVIRKVSDNHTPLGYAGVRPDGTAIVPTQEDGSVSVALAEDDRGQPRLTYTVRFDRPLNDPQAGIVSVRWRSAV